MRSRFDYVVLMGPPGSGKTYLADRIASELGFVHRPLEPELIAKFGTGRMFAENKPAALVYIENTLRQLRRESELPVVFESTGLSDRDILRRLSETHELLFVRIDTPRGVCERRVTTRDRGKNLNNDPDYATRFYDYWVETVAPEYEFDVILRNGDDPDEDPLAPLRRRLTEND